MDTYLHDLTVLIGIVTTMISTAVGTIVTLTWWLAKQFTTLRTLILDKTGETAKLITDKLEYHEHHDDERFSNVYNDLWAIKLRNAAKDGQAHPVVIEAKNAP